jgi:hypothetical protein
MAGARQWQICCQTMPPRPDVPPNPGIEQSAQCPNENDSRLCFDDSSQVKEAGPKSVLPQGEVNCNAGIREQIEYHRVSSEL